MKFNSNNIDFEYYAVITGLIEKDGKKFVLTDKSDFYAEAGGQMSDRGFIGDARIIHVKEADDTIYHETEDFKDLAVGHRVKCVIDKPYRMDISRQHTGQHLMSAILENDFDVKTVSFHMTDEVSTIDTDIPVTQEVREKVQARVMDNIGKNLAVESFVKKKEEIDRLGLRKLVEAEGDIQIIKIGDIDYNACCGTHLSNTGELKLFIIKKIENYKGGSRVYFLFGDRALNEFYDSVGIVSDVKTLLGIHETEIPFRVRLLIEKEEEERKKVSEIREKLVKLMLTLPEYNVPFIYKKLDEEEELIKDMVFELNAQKRTAVLVDIRELRMYATAVKEGFNLGGFFKGVKTSKIRGGGGPNSLQAVCDNLDELVQFTDQFKDLLFEELNK